MHLQPRRFTTMGSFAYRLENPGGVYEFFQGSTT